MFGIGKSDSSSSSDEDEHKHHDSQKGVFAKIWGLIKLIFGFFGSIADKVKEAVGLDTHHDHEPKKSPKPPRAGKSPRPSKGKGKGKGKRKDTKTPAPVKDQGEEVIPLLEVDDTFFPHDKYNDGLVTSAWDDEKIWHNVGEYTYKQKFGVESWNKYLDSEFPVPMGSYNKMTEGALWLKSHQAGVLVAGVSPLATGVRPTHPVGIGAEGVVVADPDPSLPDHPYFQKGEKFKAKLRHARLKFPDDAANDGCSCSIMMENSDGVEFCLNCNTGGALFWNVDSVIDFNNHAIPFAENFVPYLKKHPAAWCNWSNKIRTTPTSFTRVSYNGILPFVYDCEDGVERYCKYRIVPGEDWDSIQDDSGLPGIGEQTRMWIGDRNPDCTLPKDYLRSEYKARLESGEGASYRIQIQVREYIREKGSEEFFNLAKDWNEEKYPWKTLAQVQMEAFMDPKETEYYCWDFGKRPHSLRIIEAYSASDYNSIGYTRSRVYHRSAEARRLHHHKAPEIQTRDFVIGIKSNYLTFDVLPETVNFRGTVYSDGTQEDFVLELPASQVTPRSIMANFEVGDGLDQLIQLRLEVMDWMLSWDVEEVTIFNRSNKSTHDSVFRFHFHSQVEEEGKKFLVMRPYEMELHMELIQAVHLKDASDKLYAVIEAPSLGYSSYTSSSHLERNVSAQFNHKLSLFVPANAENSIPANLEVKVTIYNIDDDDNPIGSALFFPSKCVKNRILNSVRGLHKADGTNAGAVVMKTLVLEPHISTDNNDHIRLEDTDTVFIRQRRATWKWAQFELPKSDVVIDKKHYDKRIGQELHPLFPPFIGDFDILEHTGAIWGRDMIKNLASTFVKTGADFFLGNSHHLEQMVHEKLHDLFSHADPDVEDKIDSLHELNDYITKKYTTNMFYAIHRPNQVVNHWIIDDEEFARQRLGGVNCMVIKKFTGSPKELKKIIATMEKSENAATARDRLDTALRNGQLFWCDYRPWMGHLDLAVKGRYVCTNTIGFFDIQQDKGVSKLMPVTIQLEKKGIWFFPEDGFSWLFAKMHFQCTDTNDLGARPHLTYSHLRNESVSVAVQRNFSQNHPIRKLLVPHCKHTITINQLARELMINQGGNIDKANAGGRVGTIISVNVGWRKFKIEDMALPKDLENRGLTKKDLPIDFPYRDDALVMWNALAYLCDGIVNVFYDTDDDVKNDKQLQDFCQDLSSRTNIGSADIPDIYAPLPEDLGQSERFPSSITERDHLSLFLTNCIFGCSVQHAAVNNPQFPYMGFAPNMSLMLKSPPPKDKTVTPQTIFASLPNLNETIFQLTFMMQLTTPNQNNLLHGEDNLNYVKNIYKFESEGANHVLGRYFHKLVSAKAFIEAQRQRRVVDFYRMHPPFADSADTNDVPLSVYYPFLDPQIINLDTEI